MIVRVDGETVTGVDDLIRLLNADRIGRSVTFDVLRQGQLRSFDVLPTERAAPAARRPLRRADGGRKSGLRSCAAAALPMRMHCDRALPQSGPIWPLGLNQTRLRKCS